MEVIMVNIDMYFDMKCDIVGVRIILSIWYRICVIIGIVMYP